MGLEAFDKWCQASKHIDTVILLLWFSVANDSYAHLAGMWNRIHNFEDFINLSCIHHH